MKTVTHVDAYLCVQHGVNVLGVSGAAGGRAQFRSLFFEMLPNWTVSSLRVGFMAPCSQLLPNAWLGAWIHIFKEIKISIMTLLNEMDLNWILYSLSPAPPCRGHISFIFKKRKLEIPLYGDQSCSLGSFYRWSGLACTMSHTHLFLHLPGCCPHRAAAMLDSSD